MVLGLRCQCSAPEAFKGLRKGVREERMLVGLAKVPLDETMDYKESISLLVFYRSLFTSTCDLKN